MSVSIMLEETFLAVAVLGGYLLSLVAKLWLFRHGGNGLVCSFCCLFLALFAVGRSFRVWMSLPWLRSIWEASYEFLRRNVLLALRVT